VRDVARHNYRLQGVINTVDFNATAAGQRILSDEQPRALITALSSQRLGINDVEPDIIGRAYEYLLKKFAEGSGRSAGERYTHRSRHSHGANSRPSAWGTTTDIYAHVLPGMGKFAAETPKRVMQDDRDFVPLGPKRYQRSHRKRMVKG
jgi:hypothetical protein